MRPLRALIVVVGLAGLFVAGFLLFREDVRIRRSPPTPTAPKPAGAPRPAEPVTTAATRSSDDGDAGMRGAMAQGTAAPSEPSAEFSIEGRVVDARGKPVGEAKIHAAPRVAGLEGVPLESLDPVEMPWGHRTEAVTDAQGRFRLTADKTGELRLSVRARGFAPHDREIFARAGANDLGRVVLEDSAILSGRVLASSGRPVAGAVLRRLGAGANPVLPGRSPGVAVATTDERGAFRVDEIAPGPWQLLITSVQHPDRIERGQTERPGDVVSDLEFVLEDGAEIQGRVVQAPPEALPELWVLAVKERPDGDERSSDRAGEVDDLVGAPPLARCEPDGSFILRGLQRDSIYRLEARDGKHAFAGRSRTASVEARADERGVELLYRVRAALVFQVVDARTSAPITELEVRLGHRFLAPLADDSGRIQRSFPDGRVRFENLFERRESTGLLIEAHGYEELRRADLDLIDGRDLDLGILRLEPLPLFEVRVVALATGKPVAEALVTLSEEGQRDPPQGSPESGAPWRRVRTDREGCARLNSLPGARAVLSVRHGNFAPFSEALLVPAQEDHLETVRLRAGGSLLVETVDARGAPVHGVRIQHRGPAGEDRSPVLDPSEEAKSDAQGRWLFVHLEEGQHHFRVGDEDARSPAEGANADVDATWSEVAVSEGSEPTLRLVAATRSRLTGRVTEGGLPLAGAWLYLTHAEEAGSSTAVSDGRLEARTNGNGEYLFRSIRVGTYRVRVSQRSRAMALGCDLRIGEEPNVFDVDLPVAVIEGRLLDDDGQPVAGLRVQAERARAEAAPREFQRPEDASARVFSDTQGRYVLRGVESDVDLVVRASGKDYLPTESAVVRVPPDRIRSGVDLWIGRGAVLDVQVVRVAGGPGTKCSVRALCDEARGAWDHARVERTDAEGRARFTGLSPGRWRIRVEAVASGSEGKEAPIPEQVVDVELGRPNSARFELY